jgi:hypothetical protein
MKYIDTFENKISTISSKDLVDSWTIDKKVYKKGNNLSTNDLKTVDDIVAILSKYGLQLKVNSENYLLSKNMNLSLNFEKGFKEYRVYVYHTVSFEEYVENDGLSVETLSEEESKEYASYYDSYLNDLDTDAIFSVFLSPNNKNILENAIINALSYLNLIYKSFIDVIIHEWVDNNLFREYTEQFITFINSINFKVNNKNLSDIVDIEYRLYKDSKFFIELREMIGDSNFRNLINELLAIK